MAMAFPRPSPELQASPHEALIPGKAGRLPTNGMLQAAKKKVLGFLKREEAKEAKDSTSSWAFLGDLWGSQG